MTSGKRPDAGRGSPGPGEVVTDEAERIRSVYARRDRGRPRLRGINIAYGLINEERRARMLTTMRAAGLDLYPPLIDVGCGSGADLAHWKALGWPAESLAGVDLVGRRIAEARERCPGVDLRVVDGHQLPFGDDSFDVATAVTVLSSILDPAVRQALFREMWRVVRPGGLILVYDFVIRKPWNRDVASMPLRVLKGLGPAPVASHRLSPLLHLVALVAAVNVPLARLIAPVVPRTHRLTAWQVRDPA